MMSRSLLSPLFSRPLGGLAPLPVAVLTLAIAAVAPTASRAQDNYKIQLVAEPAEAIYEAGETARLIVSVRSLLPRQRIAIEGYTDNAPLYGGRFASSHQLAAAQATSVLEMLTRRAGLPDAQFFTVAPGTNHPRADTGSPQGRAANRRIDLVIYPDTF